MQNFKIKEEHHYVERKHGIVETRKYSRKIERVPLGSIQDQADQRYPVANVQKQVHRCCSGSKLQLADTKNAEQYVPPPAHLTTQDKKYVRGLAESTRIPKQNKSYGSSLTLQPGSSTANQSAPKQSSCRCTRAPKIIVISSSSGKSAGTAQSSRSNTVSKQAPSRTTSAHSRNIAPIDDDRSVARYQTLPSQKFVTLTENSTNSITTLSARSRLDPVNYVRGSSEAHDFDTVFMDAAEFFRGQVEEIPAVAARSTPNVAAALLSESASDANCQSQVERKPAVKTTINKRNSIKTQIPFHLLFCPDYLEDILDYSHDNKEAFIVKRKSFLDDVDSTCRSSTVNWLLSQMELVLPDFGQALLMSVRIFDYAVIRLKLQPASYQLAALVCMWICVKFLASNTVILAPKLQRLGKGRYTKYQITRLELQVLQCMDFCLNIPDPLVFLYEYLLSSNLENDEELKIATTFIIECSTLFSAYVTVNPAFLAAGALWLAFKVIKKSTGQRLHIKNQWYDENDVPWYGDNALRRCVRLTIVNKYEPALKYATTEKLHVVKYFYNL